MFDDESVPPLWWQFHRHRPSAICPWFHEPLWQYPLGDVLDRYADFFALLKDFRGYVQFFLLDDLVTDDYAGVRFFLPFEDFTTPPLPGSVAAYREYRDRSVDFVQAKNRRIEATSATPRGR